MDYIAHHNQSPRPGAWAAEREAEGVWHGVSTSDHTTEGSGAGPIPWRHAFITLAEIACATSQLRINPAVSNNLVRSPVEFAQISLALHELSGGRYDAALGAGWARDELVEMGIDYPDGPTRARRFRESLIIVRELITTGNCTFNGDHYSIDVQNLGPVTDIPAPRLIAAASGPWVQRNVAPIVDIVEIAYPGPGNPMKNGAFDFSDIAKVRLETISQSCDRIRTVNPDVGLACVIPFAVGSDAELDQMKQMMGDGFYGMFLGEAAEVADHLAGLEDLGISRVTLIDNTNTSQRLLAGHLPPIMMSASV